MPGTATSGCTCPGLLLHTAWAPPTINSAGALPADSPSGLFHLQQAGLSIMSEKKRKPGTIVNTSRTHQSLPGVLNKNRIAAVSGFSPSHSDFRSCIRFEQPPILPKKPAVQKHLLPMTEPAAFPVLTAGECTTTWKGALGTGRVLVFFYYDESLSKPVCIVVQGPGRFSTGHIDKTRLILRSSLPGSLLFVLFPWFSSRFGLVEFGSSTFTTRPELAGEDRHELLRLSFSLREQKIGGSSRRCYYKCCFHREGTGSITCTLAAGSRLAPAHYRFHCSGNRDCPPSTERWRTIPLLRPIFPGAIHDNYSY